MRQHRPGEFETIDIALIEAPGLRLGKGLPRGSADGLKQLDHVAIAGFPNHNFGDTGILSPGIIVGRQISSIRRLLVNAPIVAGNSGGPAINARAEVVGVAVSGSDTIEGARETEKHGIVPIDALDLLASDKSEN